MSSRWRAINAAIPASILSRRRSKAAGRGFECRGARAKAATAEPVLLAHDIADDLVSASDQLGEFSAFWCGFDARLRVSLQPISASATGIDFIGLGEKACCARRTRGTAGIDTRKRDACGGKRCAGRCRSHWWPRRRRKHRRTRRSAQRLRPGYWQFADVGRFGGNDAQSQSLQISTPTQF
ncbi:MAG: hypothetical protein R3D68_09180 [Hyphomicrobiaceae bacterium]